MLMATVVSLALGALQVGGTVWVNAYEFGDAAYTPAQGVECSAWAWVKGGASAEASIGGKTYSGMAPAADKGHEYAWAPLGKVSLDPVNGAVAISGNDIAAIVLSSEPDFDPKRFVADTRVIEDPQGVQDARVTETRDLNTVQMMPHYDKESWEETRDRIRRRILIGCGLWPMPEKTPLNAKVFDRIERDGYSVEKVYFEARPGFLVTGNLYRPLGDGPYPAVACPHGHWKTGRLENTDTCSVPGRCITLARMGIVSFSYDMLGYNDSLQFEHGVMEPALSLWGIHSFSLQLWSSIRVLDFLEGLPYVDKERLACTGASGGGTQTFALCAVDDRVKVSAPVNMISCSMQGGCVCENAPIFRLGVSNMEVGACMAPRPMLMVSATGDWTRETPRVEYPAVKEIYALYGAADNVENHHVDAGHNYNKESREAMYRFFGKHLLGGDWSNYTEPPFEVEPVENLRVFPDGKLPEGPPTAQEIIESIKQERRDTWAGILPKNDEEATKFCEENSHLLSDVTGTFPVASNELNCERVDYEEQGDLVVEKWVLGRKGWGDRIPAVLHRGRGTAPQDVVIVIDSLGKASGLTAKFYDDANDEGRGYCDTAQQAGRMTLVIDVFLQGEQGSTMRKISRAITGYQDTYQMTDFGYRVQDILTAAAFLRARRDCTGRVLVSGAHGARIDALFAAAIDGRAMLWHDKAAYEVPEELWLPAYYFPGLLGIGGKDTVALWTKSTDE